MLNRLSFLLSFFNTNIQNHNAIEEKNHLTDTDFILRNLALKNIRNQKPHFSTTPYGTQNRIFLSDFAILYKILFYCPITATPSQLKQNSAPESNAPQLSEQSTTIPSQPQDQPSTSESNPPKSNKKVPFMRRVASLISRFTHSVFNIFKSLFKKKSI